MAWDEGLAQILRDDLADMGVSEQKMFGGLAFLLNGHMVCGVHKGGTMFRVGAGNEAAALEVPGAHVLTMGTRRMSGMIGLDDAGVADNARRGRLMALALDVVRALPPKSAPVAKGLKTR